MKIQTARKQKPAGRPVDCLGLTKRWSLYVASHGDSRVWAQLSLGPEDESLRATDAMRSIRTHRLVCGL